MVSECALTYPFYLNGRLGVLGKEVSAVSLLTV